MTTDSYLVMLQIVMMVAKNGVFQCYASRYKDARVNRCPELVYFLQFVDPAPVQFTGAIL